MRKTQKEATVKHIAYHRNGISGVGFYVALLDCPEAGEMVAVRFPGEECRTAVLNVTKLAGVDSGKPEDRIGFARNSWRGDHYDGPMLKAIKSDMLRSAKEWAIKDSDPAKDAEAEFRRFLKDYTE